MELRISALACMTAPASVTGAVAPVRPMLYTHSGTPSRASARPAPTISGSCCSGGTGQ